MEQRLMVDGTGLYLKRIGRIPLLRAEEEIELGRAIKIWQDAVNPSSAIVARGKRAKEKLITSNIRLVVHIAKKFQHRGLEMDELIQEGTFGLNRAVEKFDFTQGYKFSTYAVWWIRQTVTRAIAAQSRTVRLPLHAWELLSQIKRARHEFQQQHGYEPSMREISVMVDIPEEKLVGFLESYHQTNCASLDKKLGDYQNKELIELIASENQGAFDAIAQQNLSEMLSEVLDTLSEREAFVIRMRYGLDDGEKKSFQAVGDVLGLSRERIRQIESKILKKLKVNREIRSFRGVA